MLVKKVTIRLIKPDSQTVVIPALTGIHSVFGMGIVIGTVMLFMVLASNTRLGSGIGSPPPEMSASTSIIMTLIGALLLFGSNWLRNSFKVFIFWISAKVLFFSDTSFWKISSETFK